MSVVLITGGSRGIGRRLVEAFAEAGYRVGFTYSRAKEEAEALVARAPDFLAAFQADVKDFDRAAEVVAQTQGKFGPLTTVINNAGIRQDAPLFKMTLASWREVIDTNLTGVFNYSRAAIGGLMKVGGSIVNITSVSGVIGMAGQTNYSASKAGVTGLTKALAKEVARFGVRVNAIAPGFIETAMTESMDENVRRKLYAQIPMGAAGDAAGVAKLALYLASDDAKYVTGQVWNIDGGLT